MSSSQYLNINSYLILHLEIWLLLVVLLLLNILAKPFVLDEYLNPFLTFFTKHISFSFITVSCCDTENTWRTSLIDTSYCISSSELPKNSVSVAKEQNCFKFIIPDWALSFGKFTLKFHLAYSQIFWIRLHSFSAVSRIVALSISYSFIIFFIFAVRGRLISSLRSFTSSWIFVLNYLTPFCKILFNLVRSSFPSLLCLKAIFHQSENSPPS